MAYRYATKSGACCRLSVYLGDCEGLGRASDATLLPSSDALSLPVLNLNK